MGGQEAVLRIRFLVNLSWFEKPPLVTVSVHRRRNDGSVPRVVPMTQNPDIYATTPEALSILSYSCTAGKVLAKHYGILVNKTQRHALSGWLSVQSEIFGQAEREVSPALAGTEKSSHQKNRAILMCVQLSTRTCAVHLQRSLNSTCAFPTRAS